MNLLDELKQTLQQNEEFITDQGVLIKNRVYDAAMRMDENLIKMILENKNLKPYFFKEINEILVFDKIEFTWMINSKEFLADSYTSYRNSIGLSSNGRDLLTKNNNVELVWPYKDNFLEGGQTKEDQQLDEIFYNEVLVPDQISRLLAPKVLTDAKRYSIEGVEDIIEITEKDNLIIKGNNLLALHSLLDRYKGKVKMIYLDPPYYFKNDKSSDTFSYNSNFKLSTWLTFMKNRLDIAKDLLSNDGTIFISIGNEGQAYLKILMDEIFGIDNYVETFIWKNTDNANSLASKSRSSVEFIHAYEKRYQTGKKWIGKISNNDDAPLINSSNNLGTLNFPAESIKFKIADGTYSASDKYKVELLEDLVVENGTNKNSIKLKGRFKWTQDNLIKEIEKGSYFIIKTKLFSIRYQKVEGNIVAPEKFIDHSYLEKAMGVGTYEDSNTHLNEMDINFTYSKPESLIGFLIKAVTQEEDIVLDFFMGSATTQAAAHKMKRQYIGIDQMDYVETAAIPRLNRVIEGERGGISEAVNWTEGGSFVYVQLKERTENLIHRLSEMENEKDLIAIYSEAKEKGLLIPEANTEEFEENIEEFNKLEIHKKRNIIASLLNKNKLYVNLSDLNDENMDVIKEDKEFNKSFYNIEEEDQHDEDSTEQGSLPL